MTGPRAILAGLLASMLIALAWHGPLGAGERMARAIETDVGQMLRYYEMSAVSGRLERGPLRRVVFYRGPADDFQRAELVRLTEYRPGVGEARWNRPRAVLRHPLPLWVEALALAMAAFWIGVTAAYAGSLRMREERRW